MTEEQFRFRLTQVPWRVVRSGTATGAENMARDLALLEAAIREEAPPTLRFYQWSPPAVSLGRFQDEATVNLDPLRERGWDLVRRPTGGRAVLHQHELTYSVILPPAAVGGIGVRGSYCVLIKALNAGLRSLLPERTALAAPSPTNAVAFGRSGNCFALAGECDLLTDQGKLVGSAQVRDRGALLQHGSILLDAEPEAWAALFGEAGRLLTLKDLLGEVPTADAVQEAVMNGFRAAGFYLNEER